MKLITKSIENKLLKHPLYSTDGDDWTFFGLVNLYGEELGYFTLSELQSVKLPFGLSIERDKHFEGYKYNSSTGEIS